MKLGQPLKHLQSTLEMKGWWESNINGWFWFMSSQKWNWLTSLFPNRIIMFCLSISTFMFLWAIYIFPGLVCLFCCSQIGRPIWDYINRSNVHECRNWERGLTVSFMGTHKTDFRYSVAHPWSKLRTFKIYIMLAFQLQKAKGQGPDSTMLTNQRTEVTRLPFWGRPMRGQDWPWIWPRPQSWPQTPAQRKWERETELLLPPSGENGNYVSLGISGNKAVRISTNIEDNLKISVYSRLHCDKW